MQNNIKMKLLKATIFDIIVAFLIVIIISSVAVSFGKEKFLLATELIDLVTVKSSSGETISPVLQTSEEETSTSTVLINPPDYGSQYATLKIESIGVDLPVYYGKTLDLLKKGVGHDNDSYFPGEGGSIVLMGHNFKKFLAELPNAQIGDKIQLITDYGEFEYTIYDYQIVDETETDKVPITDSEEILMIYTCWPINNIGYANQRYVVYAK